MITYRTHWTQTQSGNDRDIFKDITTIVGDVLVVFTFKSSSTGQLTIYDYDSDGTTAVSTGDRMTLVGEYSRGVTSKIAMMYYAVPSTNVGTKTIHTYNNKGMPQRAAIVALTGANQNDVLEASAFKGIYYVGNAGDSVLASKNGGFCIWGWHCNTTGAGIDEDGTATHLIDDWEDDTDSQFVFTKPSTGLTTTMSWQREGGNNDRSGFGMTLNPGPTGNKMVMTMFMKRLDGFYKDLKAGLIPPRDLQQKYGDLVTI